MFSLKIAKRSPQNSTRENVKNVKKTKKGSIFGRAAEDSASEAESSSARALSESSMGDLRAKAPLHTPAYGVRRVAAVAAALLLAVACCEVWQRNEGQHESELELVAHSRASANEPANSPPLHEKWLLAGFQHTLE